MNVKPYLVHISKPRFFLLINSRIILLESFDSNLLLALLLKYWSQNHACQGVVLNYVQLDILLTINSIKQKTGSQSSAPNCRGLHPHLIEESYTFSSSSLSS